MVEEEVSPASIPNKTIFTWREQGKPERSIIQDDGNKAILNSGNYSYVRTEESFESGQQRCEIEVDVSNAGETRYLSFGVSIADNMNGSNGVYYFNEGFIYCSYYPNFTGNSKTIHNKTPTKMLKDTFTLAVNFDIDDKKIWWEIDGEEHEVLPFDSRGKPVYVVLALNHGTANFL